MPIFIMMTNPCKYPQQKGCYGIFNDSFPPILDGVTLTVENYAGYLKGVGKTPVVVTPWNPLIVKKDYPVMRFFSIPIASRHPYRYGYPKLDPFIWRRVRSTDFKLLHSHCPFSSGRLAVYAKRYQNVPLIGTFHSKYRSDLEHSFRYAPWMVDIIMKRILDFFNACDEVWIPQAQVESTVREYGYEGKLEVVENGNDYADTFDNAGVDFKKDARKKLCIDDSEIMLLFVGQHIWEKGTDIILDALRLLKGKVKFQMHFIGTGYAAAQMKQRAEEYGLTEVTVFHGVIPQRDKLLTYYAAADLFLFPSLYDNAPLVVREAAAAMTPAIIPEGSTASEVIHDNENGFLCQRCAQAYSALISYLSDNRDLIMHAGKGARSTLVRSWNDVMTEVEQRYELIVNKYQKDHGIPTTR